MANAPGEVGIPSLLPGLVLRARRAEDLDGLFALLSQADFQRNGSTLDPLVSKAGLAGYLAVEGPGVFEIVATIDDCVVGFAGLYGFGGKQRHVASCTLAVHERFQRQGIGTALVHGLLATAVHLASVERVQLTVFTDNARAIALYRRCGFSVEGVLRRFAKRDGEDVHAFLMAWHSSPTATLD